MSKQSLQDAAHPTERRLSHGGRKSHKKLKPHKGSTASLKKVSNDIVSTLKKPKKQSDGIDDHRIGNTSEVERVSDDIDEIGSQNAEVQEAPKISATVKTKKSSKPVKDADSLPAQSITDPLEEMTE